MSHTQNKGTQHQKQLVQKQELTAAAHNISSAGPKATRNSHQPAKPRQNVAKQPHNNQNKNKPNNSETPDQATEAKYQKASSRKQTIEVAPDQSRNAADHKAAAAPPEQKQLKKQ